MTTIPALIPLTIEVTGLIKHSNFEQWRDQAIAIINDIPLNPATDEEFAEADANAKWLKDIEQQLKTAKEQAVSNISSITELYTAVDYVAEIIRDKRLRLEKTVTTEKQAKREAIAKEAHEELIKYTKFLNESFPRDCALMCLPIRVLHDAMKGKKTLNSCIESVEKTVIEEQKRLEANHETIVKNMQAMSGFEHLLKDFSAHCLKDPQTFEDLLTLRKQEEVVRLEREKLKKEAAALAEAEAQAKRQAEADSLGARLQARQPEPREAWTPAPEPKPEPVQAAEPAKPEPVNDEAKRTAERIGQFLKLNDYGPEKWKIRSILIEYEAFRNSQTAQQNQAA